VPIHPPSIHPASSATTPSPVRPTHPLLRRHATRAVVVATTSAAAALLAVLPATAAAPAVAPAPAAPAASAAAPAVDPVALLAPAPAAPALPVSNTRIAQVAVSAPVAPVAAPASSARASAVQLALSKVGSPYRWGATGPSSFDCSGLVNWAFEQAGIEVPRTSRALSQVGTPVARGDLQPGDLVFFYSPVSHVGIYIGDGQMVHASTSGKPVAISPIEGRQYNSARRL
jgi:cell wall-associated NlpC family hydrolase